MSTDWHLLEKVFTAETLMTPSRDLATWERGTSLEAIAKHRERYRYDIVPVTENGKITGLLATADPGVHALTHAWLVSTDTSVPALIDLFTETGKPGYLVLRGQDIVGLVTPADLNKVQARTFIYLLIGELEVALASWIGNRITSSETLIEELSDKRREGLHAALDRLIAGNTDVKPTQLLYLSDLIGIVEKRQELREALGFSSRSQAEAYLGGLNDLRNRTMHMVRPLISRVPEDLAELRGRVRRAAALLTQLS